MNFKINETEDNTFTQSLILVYLVFSLVLATTLDII